MDIVYWIAANYYLLIVLLFLTGWLNALPVYRAGRRVGVLACSPFSQSVLCIYVLAHQAIWLAQQTIATGRWAIRVRISTTSRPIPLIFSTRIATALINNCIIFQLIRLVMSWEIWQLILWSKNKWKFYKSKYQRSTIKNFLN